MSDRAVAQQGQEKFQFYLLSLVFTLLALSVQTAKLGTSTISDYFELAGWGFLIASGIAGLWYMETSPTLRMKMALKSEFEDYIFKMKELQLKGQT
jgi:energy-coupling factor transporter transmembrane protein EcfT